MRHVFEKEIDSLVSMMLEDYDSGQDISKTGVYDQPSKQEIIHIIDNLQHIIFPGYFKDHDYEKYTMSTYITILMEEVLNDLSRQISRVLRYDERYRNYRESDLNDIANDLTLKFMRTLPKIREYMETDIQAAFDGDPAAVNKDEIIFTYPGQYAIMIYRIAHELFVLKVPVIPRMMTEHAHSKTGIDIHPGASIGKCFFIDHGTGIVVGETTVIGDNVKVYQGVTLGALSTRGGQNLRNVKRHPTIHDNVTIYSGASILGGETVIGENVVIGGNAFITSSVPAGTTVTIKQQELAFNESNTFQK